MCCFSRHVGNWNAEYNGARNVPTSDVEELWHDGYSYLRDIWRERTTGALSILKYMNGNRFFEIAEVKLG
jgi:hypothetical protein